MADLIRDARIGWEPVLYLLFRPVGLGHAQFLNYRCHELLCFKFVPRPRKCAQNLDLSQLLHLPNIPDNPGDSPHAIRLRLIVRKPHRKSN